MTCFTEISSKIPEYKTVVTAIEKHRLPMGVTGLSYVHKAHLISSLCEQFGKKAVVITPDEANASRIAGDLTALGLPAVLFPARDFTFRSSESVSREYEYLRLNALDKMLSGKFGAVVLSAEAAMQLTVPPDTLRQNSFAVRNGGTVDVAAFSEKLTAAGYVRGEQVDGAGQFAVRGGIIDVFPPDRRSPVRIELWGDAVDSISEFDADSQRRTKNLSGVRITPAREVLCSNEELASLIENHIKKSRVKGKALDALDEDLDKLRGDVRLPSLDKYMPLIYPEQASVFDYAADCFVAVCESFSVKDKMNSCEQLMNESIKGLFEDGTLCRGLDCYTLGSAEIISIYNNCDTLYLDNLPRGSFDTPVRELVTYSAKQVSPWNGSFSGLLEDISAVKTRKGFTVCIFAGTEKAARSLCADLADEGINALYFSQLPESFQENSVSVLSGGMTAGIEYLSAKFLLITYMRRDKAPSKPRKSSAVAKGSAFNNLDELHRGEYVVHAAHGIGIFEGIAKLEAGGTIKDYIKIQYDKSDVLYVPVTQLDQVSKYIGPHNDEKPIKLNRLGGKEWQKTRSRVKGAVKDMAKELIALYSKRISMEGFAFSPDIDMQSDFERRFEFEETNDQLRCIGEVKGDMEKPYPMDRLLCGDVGFGKTEVALRAVFKCIADGKQCAVLVPTTILALQHYQTMCRRFEGFPLEVRMLSRFCTRKESAQTIAGLRRGAVDVVVGTHRLISKDVEFKDLGLIVIDEEQRFGVAQKEKLKTLFPTVDVLTLTATPIPRTLNMAMTGIRDMSVIEEAPQDRVPVQTYVIEHNFPVLVQAMETELRRGGQVYYLHNRVETIERIAAKIKEELPDATVGIAHGKMSEDELSEIWRRLLEGEIDILVCTTIIETGVDVPNVNTLIIEDADKMGLAQLHQIRGRVGRSSRRASAYFTFTRGKQLSEIAMRRLDAIREFTEFGSGFRIAMRDLELRGAGNVLGAKQHGHMEAVGYEMYVKLLEQAICEEKGIAPQAAERDCLIDLPIDAHIPPEYIESVPQRLKLYRRIADIKCDDDADDVVDELIDRFGDPPESVLGLVKIALLRGRAIKNGVYEIGRKNDRLMLYIDNLDMEKIAVLSPHFKGRMVVSAGAGKPNISFKLLRDEKQLSLLERVFNYMDDKNPQSKE